jgi:Flp pilus assembly protein TadD
MRRVGGAVALGLALGLGGLMGLTGCDDTRTMQWDPLTTTGRNGSAPALTFEAVMHIADAARAGGDYSNAVSLYRHAASMESHDASPLVGLGITLLEMGRVDEAIINFNAALSIDEHNGEALRGLARSYLRTGRPDLAGAPLAVAYQGTPNDPKLLLLIGVADDYIGQHADAQGRYRQGLQLAPADRSISLDLALSLALSEKFDEAIAILRPIASGPGATSQDRQTLALIYGIKGDQRAARDLARIDLDPASVDHNLAFYDSLRRLPPDARSRAILSASTTSRLLPRS